ncbi:hypothetical protein Emed_004345 [Eimeria media]
MLQAVVYTKRIDKEVQQRVVSASEEAAEARPSPKQQRFLQTILLQRMHQDSLVSERVAAAPKEEVEAPDNHKEEHILFFLQIRKLAAERTATPGFKGMYVFRRPLEQQAAAATAAAATAADAAAAAAAGEAAAGAGEDAAAVSRSDVVGAEFLLVEEWLNPLAAGEALNPPRGSRKEHNQMKGTLWACMAAGPL